MLENVVVERLGDQWPEDFSGDVPIELVAGNGVRGNGKGGEWRSCCVSGQVSCCWARERVDNSGRGKVRAAVARGGGNG